MVKIQEWYVQELSQLPWTPHLLYVKYCAPPWREPRKASYVSAQTSLSPGMRVSEELLQTGWWALTEQMAAFLPIWDSSKE